MMDDAGVSLGPIGMTLGGGDANSGVAAKAAAQSSSSGATSSSAKLGSNKSIASLSTEEWRKKFVNPDGTVDLFMKDDFNAASRLAGAAEFDTMTNIENVAWNGLSSDAIKTRHKVKVTDHETGEVLELDVPEGRYVLFEAEQDGWELPNACRMGCCTKCAVKVTKGSLNQPEALGLSQKYRDEGYALLCVSTATSDVECVTQDEEEVYQMQFGELFQQLATDVKSGAVVRDDFALEIADMDE
jgi:ferredoxin